MEDNTDYKRKIVIHFRNEEDHFKFLMKLADLTGELADPKAKSINYKSKTKEEDATENA